MLILLSQMISLPSTETPKGFISSRVASF